MFLLDMELIGLFIIAIFATLAVFYYCFRQFKGYNQDSGKRSFRKNIDKCNNEIYKSIFNDILEEKIDYIIGEDFNAFDCDYAYNEKYIIEINDYNDDLLFECIIVSGDSESIESDYIAFSVVKFNDEKDEEIVYVNNKDSNRSLSEFSSKEEVYDYIKKFYQENFK